MTASLIRLAKRNKFKNIKSGGFDSQLEKAVHEVLLLREKAGLIGDIRRQQTIVLQGGKQVTRIAVKIDFTAEDKKTGERFAIEAKGFETAVWILKLKLWRANPPMALEIYKGNYLYPKLVERIEGKSAA